MTVIRPNSITGINSITAQSSTVEFYDPSGNTITIQANISGNIDVVSGILTTTTLSATTVNATTVNATTLTGDGSSLTGIDATSLKDSGGTIRVQANTSGAVISGVATATQITLGDSFIKAGAVGLGTTTSSGRDAGIGTAVGTVIYVPDTGMQVYTGSEVGWRTVDSTENTAIEVTGGTKTTVGNRKYHTFTTSGSLTVSGVFGSKTANFLVVAGGGAGGDWAVSGAGANGGGGAGGVVSGNAMPLQNGTYTVTVGAGGASAAGNPASPGPAKSGVNSTIASPTITTITAKGGGGGGNDGNDSVATGGSGGGSWGGGGAPAPAPSRAATQPGTNSLYGATDYGNAGGTGDVGIANLAGGGGGAGAVGGNSTPTVSGAGGIGQPFGLDYTPSANGTSGPGPGQYFGGGGGGSTHGTPGQQNDGGAGGGAGGIDPAAGANANGTANTGGGGGGGLTAPGGTSYTMNGGSGIVIISYT